jgi:hypothetical protein
MNVSEVIATVASCGTLVSIIGLIVTVRRNTALSRLDTLQKMVSELNALRRYRASNPDIERALFPPRHKWSKEKIGQHLTIVQLANTLEWAYIARRSGFIDFDVWNSWVATWKGVIEHEAQTDEIYHESVWTFSRHGQMADDLRLMTKQDIVIDPLRKWWRR